MRKMSKEAQQRKWAALEQLVDARDAIAMEVMQEVFARLPYGQKFTLSDGSVAYLDKLSAPSPSSRSATTTPTATNGGSTSGRKAARSIKCPHGTISRGR